VNPTQPLVLAAIAAMLVLRGASAASAPLADDDVRTLRVEIDALKDRLKSQDIEIDRIKSKHNEQWLTVERAKEIRNIVQDVLADADTRASLQSDGATAGYNKGFFISSPDGNFKLVINGQLQLRYAASRLSGRSRQQLDPGTYQPPATGPGAVPASFPFPPGNNTEIKGYQGYYGENADIQTTARGFEVRRMKLAFSGHVVDPSWQYLVVLAMSQTNNQTAFSTVTATAGTSSGVQSTGPTSGNASAGPGASGSFAGLEDAWVRKEFDHNWSVKVGQFKSPFLKEELVSSKYQLAADRSLVNQLFTAKYTQGIELTFSNDCVRFMASFNDGGNNANTSAVIGTNSFNGSFTKYALTGRAEWKIAGDWKQFNDFSSPNGESFAMYIGGAVNWQRGGGNNAAVYANSWTTGGGANGTFAATATAPNTVNNGFTSIAVAPIAALQYPNNIPTNGNDDVTNLGYTIDSMIDLGGVSLYGAFIGNIAYNIPAGWVANPSGGFGSNPASPPGPPNDVPGNWSAVTSGGLAANGQPAAPAAVFIPGYGYGDSPIFSYGIVLQAGWFIADDIELFGRYEWYSVVNNGANDYAGNTASFWGALPGGSSPFANNTNGNGVNPGFPGPNANINTPNDAYIGGQTNPYYAYNFGSNPYAAQMNQIVTAGVNWFPAGVKNKAIKVTGDLAYSFNPVLFVNGIYGQSITGADYRYDGGQPGGGQWVGRLQLQLLF